MLDFRTYTFLCVCETMNFTQAAEKLHITQPAVSAHIHFLEAEYNTNLFIYKNRQLYLTESGKILKKRLMTMKNDEKKIADELQSDNKRPDSLSIGVTMTIGEYAIIHPISSYLKEHKETNIHIYYGNTKHLLNLLENGIIDLALVEGNYSKDSYAHKTFSSEYFVAACSNEHIFEKEINTIEDLTGERLLIRESGSGTRTILEDSLSARGLHMSDFPHYIEVENMHTISMLLKENCGISFMYKTAIKDDIKAGLIREIPLSDFKMKHNFDFIWEKESIYSEKYEDICNQFIAFKEST